MFRLIEEMDKYGFTKFFTEELTKNGWKTVTPRRNNRTDATYEYNLLTDLPKRTVLYQSE